MPTHVAIKPSNAEIRKLGVYKLLENRCGILGAAIKINGKVYGADISHLRVLGLAAEKGAFGKDITNIEDLVEKLKSDEGEKWINQFDVEDGFLLQDGKFVNREEAMLLVREKYPNFKTHQRAWLTSEDLSALEKFESVSILADDLLES